MESTPTDAPKSINGVYRECFNVASPSHGRIYKKNDKNFIIECVFDRLDSDTLETKRTIKRYALATTKSTAKKGCDIKCVQTVSDHLPVDLTEFTSKNGRLFAKLKLTTTSSGAEIPMLEIWAKAQPESQHLRSIDISDLAEDYKNVYNTTNTFRWCPFVKQDKLLYICRSKPINLHLPKKPKLGDPPTGTVESRFFQNEHTVVRIIDVSKDCQTTTIDMEGFSLSDSRWMDRGDKVVSVACPDEPNRMSLIDGLKRSSKIVFHDVAQSPPVMIQELTDESLCFYSPRVHRSGQRIACLTTRKNDHRGSSLCLYDINTRKQSLLIEDKEGFLAETEKSFIHSLPNNCFTENGKFILLDVAVQMKLRTLILNLEHLTSAAPTESARVLDFNHNIVVMMVDMMVDKLPNLAVCVINQNIPPNRKSYLPRLQIYDLETAVACKGFRTVASRRWGLVSPKIDSVLFTCPDNINVLVRPAEPLKIFSSEYQDLPIVVLIHKAPHKFVERHMPWLTFFNRLGLITIMINYRHLQANISTSSSQSGAETVGIDVRACLTVIRDHIEKGEVESGLIVSGLHGNQYLSPDTSKLNFVVRDPIVRARYVRDIGSSTNSRCDEKHFDLERRLREMLRSRARWPSSSNQLVDLPTLMLFGNDAQLHNLFHRFCWTNLLYSLGFGLEEGTPDPNKEAAIWLLQYLPLSGGELLV